MPRVCAFTGKKTSFGKKRAWRGQAITKGGFGLKPTGISPRTFRPNLQNVTAIIDGAPTRIKASTRAIRSGLVIKPLKRKFGYTRQQKGQATH
jgi:large subunit ribosomal protein L28